MHLHVFTIGIFEAGGISSKLAGIWARSVNKLRFGSEVMCLHYA